MPRHFICQRSVPERLVLRCLLLQRLVSPLRVPCRKRFHTPDVCIPSHILRKKDGIDTTKLDSPLSPRNRSNRIKTSKRRNSTNLTPSRFSQIGGDLIRIDTPPSERSDKRRGNGEVSSLPDLPPTSTHPPPTPLTPNNADHAIVPTASVRFRTTGKSTTTVRSCTDYPVLPLFFSLSPSL